MIIGLVGLIVSTIMILFIKMHLAVYVLVLFFGLFNSLRIFVGYILSMELMVPSYRKSFHMTISIIDKFIQIFVPILIYFTGDTKYVILCIILTSVIPLLFIYKAPDSPEFLYTNKQWDKLHAAFKLISKYESVEWKNYKFDKEINLEVTDTNNQSTWIKILRDKRTMRNLMSMCINWSTGAF